MSAFKKLNRQDAFVTSYTSKKRWNVSSSVYDSYGIEKIVAVSGSIPLLSGSADYENRLYYESIRNLYYSNFENNVISGSFENYIQSSLETGSRSLGQKAVIFSIPQNLYGVNIVPSSLTASFSDGVYSGSVCDDGEGRLFLKDYNFFISPSFSFKAGDVVYSHGTLILTNNTLVSYFSSSQNTTLKWNSSHPILTSNYICKVEDYEFNVSQNPTTITSGSTGTVNSFVTGSEFHPYITSVGLYNDSNELVAVGKLGQPVPKLSHTDMTFVIKLDM